MIPQMYRNWQSRLGDARLQVELARSMLGRRRYILLFSHMRSYSTLIGHILGSNPQIAGYAEIQHGYRSVEDLLDLRYQVWKINGKRLRGKYVFDKVLHGKFQVADEVLLRPDVTPIYALREPLASVRSVVAMGRRWNEPTWQQNPQKAAEHILNRYRQLGDLAGRRPAAAAIFTDSLVTEPEWTLRQLTGYLGLRTPLTTSYQTFEKTGVGRFGDPVGPIDAGTVVADRPDHGEVEIGPALRRDLLEAYEEAVAKLTTCEMVIGTPVSRTRRRATGSEPRRARRSTETAPVSARENTSTAEVTSPGAPPQTTAQIFFDQYPRFYGTSRTGPNVVRLNLRHQAIFGENLDVFPGARVLDIASHDGRWSFAALQAGAAEVIGIEAREDLVANSRESFLHYGAAPERFRFIAGDVFEVLAREHPKVDVVLCLGFLYHTLRYNELLHHIRATGARTLIIDTEVTQHAAPLIQVRSETVARQGNATPDRYSGGDRVVVGVPSRPALKMMLAEYGFGVEKLSDWAAILRDNRTDQSVRVYADGKRITARCQVIAPPT